MESDLDEETPNDTSSEDEKDIVSDVGSIYEPNTSSTFSEDNYEIFYQGKIETIHFKNGKYIWSDISAVKEVGRNAKQNKNLPLEPIQYAICRADSIKSSFMLLMPNEIT